MWARIKPYLLHTRLLMAPLVASTFALGYALAGGFQGGGNSGQFVLGILAWAVLGNGAALCINSHYDRDSGDVAFLNHPPPAPRYLARFGLGIGAAGLVLSAVFLPLAFTAAYLLAAALGVLYSHRRFRLKNNLVLAPLINGFGYCVLTMYAGWAVVTPHLRREFAWISVGMLCLSFAAYWMTQVYQVEDDRRRGDVTLAGRYGGRKTLVAAFASGLAGFGLVVNTVFIRVMPVFAATVALPIVLGTFLLFYWRARAADGRLAKRMMYSFFALAGLTNVILVAATFQPVYYTGWLLTDLFR